MSQTVIYVGPFNFPSGGAAARRIIGNSKSLMDYGYEVIIGTGQLKPEGLNETINLNGIRVDYIGERTAENYPALIKYLFYLKMGRKTIRWLENLCIRPKAIILYSGYSPYLMRLIPWCRRHHIPLLFDTVEWYDAPSIIHIIFNPYYWNIELAMRCYLPKVKYLIVISRYLEDYYRERACNSVRIPPTLDVEEIKPGKLPNNCGKLVLVYAGSPDVGKDSFNNILKALITVDANADKILLKVAGLTSEEILNFKVFRKERIKVLPTVIKSLGVLNHRNTIEEVKTADFSILQRPPKRNVKAGFPTKVVESLAVGTPVITNISSDLGDFITDGQEGILCADHRVKSLIVAIERALNLSSIERSRMRIKARNLAEKSFAYNNYSEKLGNFISKLSVSN